MMDIFDVLGLYFRCGTTQSMIILLLISILLRNNCACISCIKLFVTNKYLHRACRPVLMPLNEPLADWLKENKKSEKRKQKL